MAFLRAALGLLPEQPVPEEEAAIQGRALTVPATVAGLDCGAWLAWVRVGLPLFSGETLPTMRTVMNEAGRVTLALGMARHGGNITQLASTLQTSRRALRERLKVVGLYVEPPARRRSASPTGTVSKIDDAVPSSSRGTNPEGSVDAES